jgi:integral membrane protein
MTGRSLSWLRRVGLAEGVSYLLLLGVAMPLKYLADMPLAVKVVGWLHGVLFLALGFLLLSTMRERSWPLRRGAMVLLAALLPFGPFVIDGRLRREEQEPASGPSPAG